MDKVISPENPKPLYVQIADWIREKTYSKEWGVNTQLPSEEELSKQLQVSRGTLRKAISLLVKEGILVQIHGKGTFVASPKFSHPLGQGLISFAESMSQQGLTFKTKVIEKRFEIPKKSLQEKLGITEDQSIFFLKRVRYVDDEPVIIMENYVNASICKGIDEADFEKESLFSEFEKRSGKKIKYGMSRFAARVLGKERAELLSLPQGSPVLHLEQVVYLEDDIPVENGSVWLKSNKYVVASILQRT